MENLARRKIEIVTWQKYLKILLWAFILIIKRISRSLNSGTVVALY